MAWEFSQRRSCREPGRGGKRVEKGWKIGKRPCPGRPLCPKTPGAPRRCLAGILGMFPKVSSFLHLEKLLLMWKMTLAEFPRGRSGRSCHLPGQLGGHFWGQESGAGFCRTCRKIPGNIQGMLCPQGQPSSLREFWFWDEGKHPQKLLPSRNIPKSQILAAPEPGKCWEQPRPSQPELKSQENPKREGRAAKG